MKYPYLPEGYTIQYVGNDNPFMQQAKEVARTSNEHHMPTGAVAVCNNEIIAKACNHAPLSSPILINLHKTYCFRKLLKVKSGQKYWLCPGCASPGSHAEARAMQIVKGKHIRDFDLYLWGHYWACKDCWNTMIDAGVKNVFLLQGSEVFFDKDNPHNVIGKQFEM